MHHFLLPGLVDTEVGGIHNPADVHISEILTPVLKRHPVSWDTRKAMFFKKKNCDSQPKSQNNRTKSSSNLKGGIAQLSRGQTDSLESSPCGNTYEATITLS